MHDFPYNKQTNFYISANYHVATWKLLVFISNSKWKEKKKKVLLWSFGKLSLSFFIYFFLKLQTKLRAKIGVFVSTSSQRWRRRISVESLVFLLLKWNFCFCTFLNENFSILHRTFWFSRFFFATNLSTLINFGLFDIKRKANEAR